ncbi:PIG-L deacetylase family protein [Selenomonas sp. ND2010]|uniref:PIG-L deacetylase family protein n=1 Tax=Selenomonas sp. ND2010 TaxID=1410618 RepID=UPI00051B6DDA|nr:PIG-L family deacetylase [Selenomonas sp. ND2010]
MIFNNDFYNKCLLVIIPHPDDDLLGTGGLLVKYGENVDTICVSSSGIPSIDGRVSAEERNRMRINEWYEVMKLLKVNNTYINSTYGDDFPFIAQLNESMEKIIDKIDLSKYDYIFIPGFLENHEEHRWVTYTFTNALLKKKHKKSLKIALYEVWALLPRVTDYLDISSEMDKILDLFKIYKSQLDYVDYDKRLEGLARYRGLMASRVAYAEAYVVISIFKYRLIRLVFGIAIKFKKLIRIIRGKSGKY